MKEKSYYIPIGIVTVLIPVVVLIINIMPKPSVELGFDLKILPAFNALLNAITTGFLTIGFYFIRNGKIQYHKRCMLTAFVLSILFLLSYVLYHTFAEETKYGGEGWLKTVYFSLLISHIILAGCIVPLALITLIRALSERFDKHKKIARWTLPLWLYVTVTGVIVYFMIAPYY